MEESLETAWIGPKSWVGRNSESQGVADSVSQDDGGSDVMPACQLWEGSEKKHWPLPALLSARKLPFQLPP